MTTQERFSIDVNQRLWLPDDIVQAGGESMPGLQACVDIAGRVW